MIWLLLGCHLPKESTQEALPDWTWLATDPHVHSSLGSNDTDGLGTPNAVLSAMETAGLDLIWLTDHSNSQGSMTCEDVEDCPNQGPEMTVGEWPDSVILASEISPRSTEDNLSTPVGHIGCLPMSVENFSEATFTDRPFGTVTGDEAIRQCHDAGGFAILNHPFGPTSWVAFDWTSLDFDAMEVYNGGAGFDASDEAALERWEEGRREGYDWVPIGASDCHRWDTEPPGTLLDAPLGWPRTWLAVSEHERPHAALSAGKVILGDPLTHLRYWAVSETELVAPGQEITLPATLVIEAHTEAEDMELHIIDLHQGLLAQYPLDDSAQTIRLDIQAEGLIYVRVSTSEPSYGLRGFAMGNVIEYSAD